MIIFKDRITNDEMFSDTYKMKLVLNDMMYEVEGEIKTESTTITDDMIGGNASAEGGGDDGGEDTSESGCNIVIANRLKATGFDKSSFTTYMKDYCKRLLGILKKEDAERAALFEKNMPAVVKHLLKNFKNWEFFTGESQDPEGLVALLDYREDGTTPYMLFFKDGLIEEKV